MEESLVQSNLKEYEEITVDLVENEVDSVEQAKRTLVGKFFSEKILNRGAVKTVVAQAWGEPDGLLISDMGPNIFLFTFKDKQEAMDVMQKGPWFIMNQLLNIQRWIPEASVFEIDFTWVPCWVQLHGMPYGTMKRENAVKIAEQIGKIVEVENPIVNGCMWRSFMRVKVLINVYKPLLTGCWVPRRDLPKTWVVFRYEKLQGLCFNCGIIGHEQMSCRKAKVMSVINQEVPRYSAQLSIPAARHIQSIVQEWGRRKSKPANQGTGDSSLKRHMEEGTSAGTPAQYKWDGGFPNSSEAGEKEEKRAGELTVHTDGEGGNTEEEERIGPNSSVWTQVMEAISLFQAEKEKLFREETKGVDDPLRNNAGPSGKRDEVEGRRLPGEWRGKSSDGSLLPVKSNQKQSCPMTRLGSLPFINLRLQSEYPGFKLDCGLNHVRVGQVRERVGPLDSMGQLIAGPILEREHDEDMAQNEELRASKGKDPLPMSEEVEEQNLANLGSAILAQVQLEEECIGQNDVTASLDFPSPDLSYIGYGGISLSKNEIQKCRNACTSNEDRAGSQYFVDFPSDDGGDEASELKTLPQNEEAGISQGLSKLCHSKRQRIE